MKILTSIVLFFIAFTSFGQQKIEDIINQEYEQGHFNGSVLVVQKDKKVAELYRGYANFQFKVPIDANTRFPIASVTKLFTSLLILQLHEKGDLHFDDKIGKYVDGLPADCQDIKISQLLIHRSGLKNEPIKAYLSIYKLDDYIKNFVTKSTDTGKFNYNNVDFILLSKVIEKITKLSYAKAVRSYILSKISMDNSGFVTDDDIVQNLAYGYHNYTFGKGKPTDTLYNDRRYIDNYYGAGQIYSTINDLYKLIIALKTNKLISEKTKQTYLVKAQSNDFIKWINGAPTYGFYINQTGKPFITRSGSIDGFNSEIIADPSFNNVVIILCNTDTGNIDQLSEKLFGAIN